MDYKSDVPNFFRDTFPYSLPPLVHLEDEPVPLARPERIWITDTTFRDGQQSRAPYAVGEIVRLFELLARLGGPNGMIRQSEFFLYTRKDREAVERCQELALPFPEVTGWIRATMADYALVRAAGLRETGILCSISDYHIFKKLGSTREKVIAGYLEVVDAALADGVVPRVHIEDSTRADIPGVVVPFVRELMERGRQAGIQVKLRYPDTMGVGIADPHAALPRGIPRLSQALRAAGVPSEALECGTSSSSRGRTRRRRARATSSCHRIRRGCASRRRGITWACARAGATTSSSKARRCRRSTGST